LGLNRAQRVCGFVLAGALGFIPRLHSQDLLVGSTLRNEPSRASGLPIKFRFSLQPYFPSEQQCAFRPLEGARALNLPLTDPAAFAAASTPGDWDAAARSAELPGTMSAPIPATGSPSSGNAPASSDEGRPVSWKLVVPNFLSDQKHIWLFPLRLAEGQHWKPTLAAVGITAGLVALDPHTAPYFRHTDHFLTFNDVFKVTTTERVFLGLPVVYYFFGLAHRDPYAQHTAFFAAEAIADVDLLAGVMRSVDGRLHPRDIPLNGDYTHTWFKAKGTYLNRGSFPSGHTAGAFAVATVFARRYGRRHRWVPWVAYSLAGLTGVSRITDSAHFPSDAFVGGLIAYTIARFVVLREP
jgi:hypothetical protein